MLKTIKSNIFQPLPWGSLKTTIRKRCQSQVWFCKETLSWLYIFMSAPFRGLAATKKSSKKCLQKQVSWRWNWYNFQKPMLVYFESFDTVQIAHTCLWRMLWYNSNNPACLRRIFQYGRVCLHFIYDNI